MIWNRRTHFNFGISQNIESDLHSEPGLVSQEEMANQEIGRFLHNFFTNQLQNQEDSGQFFSGAEYAQNFLRPSAKCPGVPLTLFPWNKSHKFTVADSWCKRSEKGWEQV